MTTEITETREYEADSVTWVMACGGVEFTRRVEINCETENYGEDADGRRGMRVRFIAIDRVLDKSPDSDSPFREDWDDMVPSAESLLNDWQDNYSGEDE